MIFVRWIALEAWHFADP